MVEEKFFDYEKYIQERLKEIDNLDERRYAKELLLNSLGEVFKWTEAKYEALEQRIREELAVSWKRFHIAMTIIEKENYDPINSFWHPICEEDIGKETDKRGYMTIYLEAGEREYKEFLKMDTIDGTEEETGRNIRFQIRKSLRYEKMMKKLYALFSSNHIPWQTVHMGHVERFFDLAPEEEILADSKVIFQWGEWEKRIKRGFIPLWNMEKTMVQSQEFRHPRLDEVIYEHIYYLGNGQEEDGYLIEAGDNILSIRYEKNKALVKTEKEVLEKVFLYRLHQGNRGNSYGYRYPILSNERKDNLAVRYLQQTGNFIQTPMELHRKAEELSGGYKIRLAGYEIRDAAENDSIGETDMGAIGRRIEGDMNGYIGTQIFSRDKRSVLLFRFQREAMEEGKEAEREGTQGDYLYESQIKYILSQLQMEFLEYRCMGTVS